LADFFESFHDYLKFECRYAVNTLAAYMVDLRDWQGALELNLSSKKAPLEGEIFHSLMLLNKKDYLPATEQRKIAVLKSYVKFRSLNDNSWQACRDFLPSLKAAQFFPNALAKEEINLLLAYTDAKGLALRNKALLSVMYFGGLRVSEALALKWQDLDRHKYLLRIRISKGLKERLIPCSKEAYKDIYRYKKHLWDSWAKGHKKEIKDYIFISSRLRPLTRMAAWKILKLRALEVGIEKKVHPHSLRHSLATHLINGGANIRAVQLILGHSSISSTERYLKVEQKDVIEVFKNFHPAVD